MHYHSASRGNYDLYVVFVEHGLQLLQPRGQLAFILPHKFFNSHYGQPLRELISKGKHLRHVVHFGDQQIFPGATNYVCLLFLAKGSASACRWMRVGDLPHWLENQQSPEGRIGAQQVADMEWNFAVGQGSDIFGRLEAMPLKLADVADGMFVGLQTSADTVFLFKKWTERKAGIVEVTSKELGRLVSLERGILKKVVRSGDIGRYHAAPEVVVLFPYEVTDREARLYSQKEMRQRFPLAWDYLKVNKLLLEGREKNAFKDEAWYRFGRTQNLGVWEQPKLMVPYMVTRLSSYYDEGDNYYFINVTTGGYGITTHGKYGELPFLCAILNSAVADFFFKRISSAFHGGYYAANKQFIERIPVPMLDLGSATDRAQHDALVALVDRILKAKRADGAADTAALEREIDERVYRLYGLTAEEIKIVEEAGK